MYRTVSLCCVVSKVFEKLVNNSFVDHLEKWDIFSDFQYGFRSSRSTSVLVTVVSNRIARAFDRSGATRAVALDISKAFERDAALLHKLRSYGISDQIFGLVSFFLCSSFFLFPLFFVNASKNIESLIRFLKILSLEVALYLYKSTIRPYMQCCCHLWAGAPRCYLDLLDKLQKRTRRTSGS